LALNRIKTFYKKYVYFNIEDAERVEDGR